MANEKIGAMIRHIEEHNYDREGGRTGGSDELVTDCEACGKFDEACARCTAIPASAVWVMLRTLKWAQKQGA